MPERNDEFYVGYLPTAPRGFASRARFATTVILALATLLALVLVSSQGQFAKSEFEFGVYRDFSGVVDARPYPTLLVERPGASDAASRFSRYHLVAFGKRGAHELVSRYDGRSVRLQGSLIYRAGHTMIEIVDGSVEPLDGDPGEALRPLPGREEDLGEMTLVGEIVDTKCFLGVMKPGNLKPHKSCAVRCISGGIPPTLVVRDAGGRAEYFLLVSPDGRPVNRQVLHLVAESVEITGRVLRQGERLILKADPQMYRRL